MTNDYLMYIYLYNTKCIYQCSNSVKRVFDFFEIYIIVRVGVRDRHAVVGLLLVVLIIGHIIFEKQIEVTISAKKVEVIYASK